MATHPKKSKSPKKVSKAKVAEPVKVKGVWRVRCYKCGLLPEEFGAWHRAATAAWKHGKH